MGKRIEMDLSEKEKLIQECLAGRMRMREAARRAKNISLPAALTAATAATAATSFCRWMIICLHLWISGTSENTWRKIQELSAKEKKEHGTVHFDMLPKRQTAKQ